MTKQHFEAIATIFASRVSHADPELEAVVSQDVNALALDLADYFASVNPRFDKNRFMSACKTA